jgi:hypothetical protein
MSMLTINRCERSPVETYLGMEIKSLGVLFPPLGAKKWVNKVPVEYPAFERNEKVER